MAAWVVGSGRVRRSRLRQMLGRAGARPAVWGVCPRPLRSVPRHRTSACRMGRVDRGHRHDGRPDPLARRHPGTCGPSTATTCSHADADTPFQRVVHVTRDRGRSPEESSSRLLASVGCAPRSCWCDATSTAPRAVIRLSAMGFRIVIDCTADTYASTTEQTQSRFPNVLVGEANSRPHTTSGVTLMTFKRALCAHDAGRRSRTCRVVRHGSR